MFSADSTYINCVKSQPEKIRYRVLYAVLCFVIFNVIIVVYFNFVFSDIQNYFFHFIFLAMFSTTNLVAYVY